MSTPPKTRMLRLRTEQVLHAGDEQQGEALQLRPPREFARGEQPARFRAPRFALALEDGGELVALGDLGGEDLDGERPGPQRVDEVVEEAGVALGRGQGEELFGPGVPTSSATLGQKRPLAPHSRSSSGRPPK